MLREGGSYAHALSAWVAPYRAYLADRHCPEGQGYLFGRPVPAMEFETRLRQSGFLKPPVTVLPRESGRPH